ncbi:sensor histidine kinase [Aporhodopirellula aestuarii]|uniref:histidine kinase n=1 Tax=Aporhodopirellula aestuarii TaxID=2950107 RepID=A0ABT0U6B8_9BACT|nr:ATP-binding protein [Aporhodopirellula aestuarii]MCM2372470.1 ATP-binding protein [Aporhodopirellula aestuarii]
MPYLFASAAKIAAIRQSPDVIGGPLELPLDDIAQWIDQSREVARKLMSGISYPPAAIVDPIRAAKEFLDEVLDFSTGDQPPIISWPSEQGAGGSPISGKLPSQTAIAVYRLTTEFVRNAVRHADAKLIEVSVKDSDQGVLICVTDDGTGYDPDKVSREQIHGLTLAKQRAAAGGVELQIESCQQRNSPIATGTRVTMKVKM